MLQSDFDAKVFYRGMGDVPFGFLMFSGVVKRGWWYEVD